MIILIVEGIKVQIRFLSASANMAPIRYQYSTDNVIYIAFLKHASRVYQKSTLSSNILCLTKFYTWWKIY